MSHTYGHFKTTVEWTNDGINYPKKLKNWVRAPKRLFWGSHELDGQRWLVYIVCIWAAPSLCQSPCFLSLGYCCSDSPVTLGQWLSTFPMLWPLNKVHVVMTPDHKIILFLLHNCDFATAVHHNINIWYAFTWYETPQRGTTAPKHNPSMAILFEEAVLPSDVPVNLWGAV